MPNPANIHLDVPLTNFALQYKKPELLGYELAPVIPVLKESDKYFVFGEDREDITPGNFLRADGAKAAQVRFDATEGSYSANEYAARYFITDRRMRNADAPVKLRVRGTQLISDKLALAKEFRVQALLQGTGGGLSSATPSTKWDASSPDIEGDINTARQAIVKASGVEPNFMLMSRVVADALVIAIKEQLVTLNDIGQRLSFIDLPDVLWGLRVLIGRGIKNTATPGQTVVTDFIWNETVVIGYIEPSVSLDVMSLIYTIQSQAPRVKSWRDEERNGEWIEESVVETEKVVASVAGYKLSDVLT